MSEFEMTRREKKAFFIAMLQVLAPVAASVSAAFAFFLLVFERLAR